MKKEIYLAYIAGFVDFILVIQNENYVTKKKKTKKDFF